MTGRIDRGRERHSKAGSGECPGGLSASPARILRLEPRRADRSSPEGRARYVKRLGELSSSLMNKETLRNRIEGWAEKIKPTLVELGQDKAHGRALWLFEQRVERRVEFVARQWPILEKSKEGKAPKK